MYNLLLPSRVSMLFYDTHPSSKEIPMKYYCIVTCCFLIMSCAGSKESTTIDLSKLDVNNTLSTVEQEKATATMYITTDPPSADVFMDGKYIGKANRDVVFLFPGKHEITLIKDDWYLQKTMTLLEGSNQPLDVKLLKIE